MRTSFVTAAAVAATASAVDIDAMAVPDFIAGVIFGLTGDNHLDEIRTCYQGGDTIVNDAKIALDDMKHGSYLQAVQEVGDIINQFPTALTNCKNMDDDFAEIEDWAKIFTKPVSLVTEASKNWLLHHKKVKADIAQEEADWHAGQYFDAGKDTASAIDLLVPFSDSQLTQGLPVKGAVEFLGGFLDGFIDDNHMDEIKTCEIDAQKEGKAVEQAFADLKAGHKVKAIMELKKLVTSWKTDLADCAPPKMQKDIQAFENWAQVFKDPKKLIKQISKSMIFHKADIEQDFEEMETDWKTGDYYLSGESLADLITVAIGSVEDPHYDLDAEAIPDFVAGFIYQLTGDNQMTEIEQCWTGGEHIVDDAEAALADIKAGHYIKGAEDLYTVIKGFPDALSTCKNMGDDLDKIEDWAKVFAQPGTLAKELSKNWLLHHKKVKADIAKEEADWSSENYFAAGEDTAAAIELLVPFKESSDKVEFDIMAVPDFAAGFLYGMVGDNHLTEF